MKPLRDIVAAITGMLVAITAQAQAFEYHEVSAGGADFIVVRAGDELTIIPRTILLGGVGSGAVSFILQRGMGIGTEPPYFLNANLTYRFDTAREKLRQALSTLKMSTGDKLATQQLFRYRAYVSYWDPEKAAYETKLLDSGTSNTSATFVTVFEIKFDGKDALQKFFAQPDNVRLSLELEVDLRIPFAQGGVNLGALVNEYVSSDFPKTAFPITTALSDLEKAHGSIVQPHLDALVQLIRAKLMNYQVVIGDDGQLAYRMSDPKAGVPEGDLSLPPRLVTVPDRLLAWRTVDICGDDSQLLLIDTGQVGCESLDDYLEAE